MNRRKKIFLITAVTLIISAACIAGGFTIFAATGKKRLQERKENIQISRVKYHDSLYEYNQDILTFLIMGIDKGKNVIETYEIDDGGAGQADALFLAVLNPNDKSIKIIGINRNTMTYIDAYDEAGNHYTSYYAQIALQHGYGDGDETSCEYQLKTVKNLFYNIPIHGYVAINIDAIPTINDAIGGVEVEVLEDLSAKDPALTKGSRVHLMGESAYWYIKYRDIDIFASVDMRTDRQKQYLNAFIDASKKAIRKNMLVTFDLYKAIESQMVTDISLEETVYLASVLRQYQFDEASFINLPGETVMGEIFEEFYPDENALYEMILDIFYQEVSENNNL